MLFGPKLECHRVGDGGDGNERIFPGHPGPISSVPRDNISRRDISSRRQVYKEIDGSQLVPIGMQIGPITTAKVIRYSKLK